MPETIDLSFLLYSPEYRQNATFVTACYKVMLNRDIEAEELFRWCRQLDGFYSRRSLIAALSGSVKFGNRFEIKDLDLYKKRAFIPRAVQHFINKMNKNGRDKGCLGLLPGKHIKFDFLKYENKEHSWSDELDMLSLCQIESLKSQIAEHYGSVRIDGIIAEDIVEHTDEHSDTLLVTGVDSIVNLMENAGDELRQAKTLLLPIPVPTEKGIAVIFDKAWSAGTKGTYPRRWLVNRGTGCIVFLNNHEYAVAAKISFNLTTLVKHASVNISQGQNSKTIHLRKKAAHVTLDTVLLPGENSIRMRFIGTTDEADEITNIAVSRLAVDGIQNTMSEDMNRLGEGYYAAVYPDCQVRNILHNSGYSEIECIRFFHDNSIQRERTTRFLQHDPNSSGDSFYVLKESEKRDKQDSSMESVRLYIARKTSGITESEDLV